MSEPQSEKHPGLPVSGYQPQSAKAIMVVNEHKAWEERLLRAMDQLHLDADLEVDARWMAIARTHFEQGFMALNRAVFKPSRIDLPEDKGDAGDDTSRS